MRPLGTGNGAKQELEQLRVNVNPSSHKQLKIILTSEEGDGVGSSESTFFRIYLGQLLSCFHESLGLYYTIRESYIIYCLLSHMKCRFIKQQTFLSLFSNRVTQFLPSCVWS